MGNTLYLECNTGISGDMTVAALIDLGADKDVLIDVLNSMPLEGFDVEISRVKKSGLDVCDFNVKLEDGINNHDHDMEYLYGHDEAVHHHEHHHEHHHHEHRGLKEIEQILDKTHMSIRARELSKRIFNILAQAEACAHGTTMEEVHFHEVGAVDSIVDIVATAVCIDNLDITNVIVPYMCEGYGTVRCQHGILPIPVPAVANIVQSCKLSIKPANIRGELVTPTGAAIVAALKTDDKLPDKYKIIKAGMGAGKRNYEIPSLLRAMIISEASRTESDSIYKLETNIDDCTGEELGFVMDLLFEKGARDVHYTPIYMKKNRPAYLLTVICDEGCVGLLEEVIFRETTTIGIRRVKMERTVLERTTEQVELDIGSINVKKCTLPDGSIRKYPEYEGMAELARKNNMPLPEIISLYNKKV